MPLQDIQNTLQVFISTGEDVEESSTSSLHANYRLICSIFISTSGDRKSFFDFVLSTMGSNAFDDYWWTDFLVEATSTFCDRQMVLSILPFCNQKIIYRALVTVLYGGHTPPNSFQLQMVGIFFERAEGLTLFSCFPPFASLIQLASRSSYKFALLQHIFKSLQIDKKDLIPPDVEIQDQGWTGQSLGVLFTYPTIPFSECNPSWEDFLCEKCNYRSGFGQSIRVSNDVPWQQKVQRIKDGLDPDGPLTEKERQEQEEWNGYVEAENEGVCEWCHKKSLEEKTQQEAYGLGLNYFTC